MLSNQNRKRFDIMLDGHVAALPSSIHELLEEAPLIVDDEPTDALLGELGFAAAQSDLCGLHEGIPLTERSVEHDAVLPTQMMLFRGPIMRLAASRTAGRGPGGPGGPDLERELDQQIRITLLHEIGHHFGLDEDDLDRLGYG